MDKIINIQNIDPTTLELQTYSTQDQNLISSFDVTNTFTSSVDYIEYTVYDFNQSLLLYINNFSNYSILDNNLQIDPEQDLTTYGFSEGQYITNYNFFTNILGSSKDNTYYISEISSDRTEIRLDSNTINPLLVTSEVSNYTNQLQTSNYYTDFYLNFGSNQLIIANNVLLDNSNPVDPTVLIKLYEPLPDNFDIKSELWAVETIANPLAYQASISLIFDNLDNNIQLRGPNLNIPVKDRVNNSTEFINYNSLVSNNSIPGTSSLQYQLNSLLIEKGIELNIDYNDYSNFTFFSSAQTRLENFYYKVSLIETYQANALLSTGSSSTSYYVSSSYDVWQNKINDIITNFDGYEYFLYFDSGSKSWPKTNTSPPYVNAPVSSLATQNWINIQYTSASYYDENLNPNRLVNTIPNYLTDDPINNQYQLFVDMIGQHFDSIWVYIKDIGNKYNADNRLDYGISKDLIADVLRDLGIKIYQNNFSTTDLYSSFIGITPGGSLTASTGSEMINTYVTASLNGYSLPGYVITGYSSGNPIVVPLDDVNKSIYKRIYHNLPYLLKKKGTVEGLRALITLYGIPDSILRINEFGGKNKNDTNDWDQWENEYNQALYFESTISSSLSNVQTPWVLNPSWNTPNVPSTVYFRFKTPGLSSAITTPTQSLWYANSGSYLTLKYTGSGYTSASYSGANTNAYNEYAVLEFKPSGSVSSSVFLPFYNGEWWSVGMTNNGNNTFTLFAGNSLYNGNDGVKVGYYASSSVTTLTTSSWLKSTSSSFSNTLGTSGSSFIGSLQEIRYYTIPLSESVFKNYIMNPYSTEGNTLNSTPNVLAFRASLGGELYTNTSSLHPKISGSWITTSSFGGGNSSFTISTSSVFVSNNETIFLNQPPVGIQNIVNHKIKIANTVVPIGDTLSPYISIQQELPISGSYTKDVNLLEVAFSPQNEINRDIIDQLGYFNIGEYIGDPRQFTSSYTSYPDLNKLRNDYFTKYTSNYNLNDYVRLIKYFDNSLFKMIKDFVPARTSLASGIVIKQHLLERNRYRVPSASFSELDISGSVKSFPFDFASSQLYKTSGGSAGSFPDPTLRFNFYTSSLSIIDTNSYTLLVDQGNLNIITTHDGVDSIELYDGLDTSGTLLFTFPIGSATSYNFNINSSTGYLTFYNGGGTPSALNNLYISSVVSSNQSWIESIVTPLGLVEALHSDQSEFLTGDLKGSTIIATTQSLNNNIIITSGQVGSDAGASIAIGFSYLINFNFLPDQTYYMDFTIDNTSDGTYDAPVALFSYGYPEIYNTNVLAGTSVNIKSLKIENNPSVALRFLNQKLFGNPITVSNIKIYSNIDNPLILNPILNNVVNARLSNNFQEVDYNTGQLIPTNQQYITGNIAPKAEIQDYNYNLQRSTIPRYKGSKTTSAQYNIYTAGDISYGSTAAVDKYQSLFLTFKGMSGAYPELINKSTMYVNSLVDDKGEQITVGGTSSVYYANLLDNFGKDYFAGITINDKTTGKTLHQDTTIYRPGSGFPNVILTNESGSNSYPVPTYSTASILFRQQVDGFGTGSSAFAPSGSVVMYDAYFGLVTGSVGGTIEPQVRKTTPGDWSFDTLYCSNIIGSIYADSFFGNTPWVQNNSASLPFGGVGGYGEPVPFSYTPGLYSNLELRFNQDESLVYSIVGIDYQFVTGIGTLRTVLFLDKNIPNSYMISGSATSTFSGTTTLTKQGSSAGVWNSSFSVYFVGYSGSYYTKASPPTTFNFDGLIYDNFIIGPANPLFSLSPGRPSQIDFAGYQLWIKNLNTNKWYYWNTKAPSAYFTTIGVNITLTGPTNTNFDADLINSGFILSTDPTTLKDTIPAYNQYAVGSSGFLIRQYSEDTSQILINGNRLIAGVPGYMKPQFLSPTLSASFDATIQELKKEGII